MAHKPFRTEQDRPVDQFLTARRVDTEKQNGHTSDDGKRNHLHSNDGTAVLMQNQRAQHIAEKATRGRLQAVYLHMNEVDCQTGSLECVMLNFLVLFLREGISPSCETLLAERNLRRASPLRTTRTQLKSLLQNGIMFRSSPPALQAR